MKEIYKDIASISSKVAEKGLDKVKELATTIDKVAQKSVDKYKEVTTSLKSTIKSEIEKFDYKKYLLFELTADKRGYAVIKVSLRTTNDGKIVVPSVHNGLPVVEIANTAFSTLYWCTEIVLPDTIEYIGRCAFSSLSQISVFNIPKNVRVIDRGAFLGSEIKRFSVDEENEYFCAIDGVLFTKDKTELVAYPIDNGESFYYVPDDVVKIRRVAFYHTGLEKVALNDNLLEIGDGAFDQAYIKEINFPPYLKRIGSRAFDGCKLMQNVVIPATVDFIGHEAFYDIGKDSVVSFEKPTDYIIKNAYEQNEKPKKVKAGALKNIKKSTKFLTDKFCQYDWTAIRKSDKKAKE